MLSPGLSAQGSNQLCIALVARCHSEKNISSLLYLTSGFLPYHTYIFADFLIVILDIFFIARPVYLNLYYVMAKRYGNSSAHRRRRRTVDGKRQRLDERVRIRAEFKLRSALNMPALINERGAEFNIDIADSDASSYLRRVLRLEAELDPELYCCSPVSSADEGEEF